MTAFKEKKLCKSVISVNNASLFHNVPTRNALRSLSKQKKLQQQGHQEKLVKEQLLNFEYLANVTRKRVKEQKKYSTEHN